MISLRRFSPAMLAMLLSAGALRAEESPAPPAVPPKSDVEQGQPPPGETHAPTASPGTPASGAGDTHAQAPTEAATPDDDDDTPDDEEARERIHAHHMHNHALIVALTGTANGGFSGEDATWRGGGDLALELPVLHHQLELEVSLGLAGGKDGLAGSAAFLFKHPFHIGNHWRPYVALGPAVSFERKGANPTADFGIAANVGAYYWFTWHWAILGYAEYTAAFAKPFRNEVVFALGAAYAFVAEED